MIRKSEKGVWIEKIEIQRLAYPLDWMCYSNPYDFVWSSVAWMRKGSIYAKTGVDAFLFATTLRFYSTVKPGAARWGKLFEFRGLGSIPNKRKMHEVITHACLPLLYRIRYKKRFFMNSSTLKPSKIANFRFSMLVLFGITFWASVVGRYVWERKIP